MTYKIYANLKRPDNFMGTNYDKRNKSQCFDGSDGNKRQWKTRVKDKKNSCQNPNSEHYNYLVNGKEQKGKVCKGAKDARFVRTEFEGGAILECDYDTDNDPFSDTNDDLPNDDLTNNNNVGLLEQMKREYCDVNPGSNSCKDRKTWIKVNTEVKLNAIDNEFEGYDYKRQGTCHFGDWKYRRHDNKEYCLKATGNNITKSSGNPCAGADHVKFKNVKTRNRSNTLSCEYWIDEEEGLKNLNEKLWDGAKNHNDKSVKTQLTDGLQYYNERTDGLHKESASTQSAKQSASTQSAKQNESTQNNNADSGISHWWLLFIIILIVCLCLSSAGGLIILRSK
jgi:hypothetical protein